MMRNSFFKIDLSQPLDVIDEDEELKLEDYQSEESNKIHALLENKNYEGAPADFSIINL